MADGPFRCSTTLEVRWRDLDMLGHVNHAVYLTYLEQAQAHYLREPGAIPNDPSGIGYILAEASCQFRSPLGLGSERRSTYGCASCAIPASPSNTR